MNNILDHIETIIEPKFKERFGNICIGLIQITVIIFFSCTVLGKGVVWITTNIMEGDVLFIKILAVLLVLIYVGFALGVLAFFVWQAFGKEKITITNSAIIVERFCLLKFEKRINFNDINYMEYFTDNIRLAFRQGIKSFPHNFGKVKIYLKDNSNIILGYDISHKDFVSISRGLNHYKSI